MTLLVVAVVMVGVAVTAMLVLAAANAAERAVRVAAVERRRDHWRRLGEAAHDVQRAADHYQRAVLDALALNGGDGQKAQRAERVRSGAGDYQDACQRLDRILCAGPRPPHCQSALLLLTDQRNPETVAATHPADTVQREVAALQDTLDTDHFDTDDPWRTRGSVRTAITRAHGRLRNAWRI